MIRSMPNLLIALSFLIANNGIHAVQKGGGSEMIVFIRHSDQTTAMNVPFDATVGELIHVANASGIPESSSLSFNGQELIDVDAQLCDLGIGAEATLTAQPRVYFEGVRDIRVEDFDVSGKTAILKAGISRGNICFADKTSIGRISKMKIRVTNRRLYQSYLYARDIPSTNFAVCSSDFYRGSHEQWNDITITVDAMDPCNIKILYEGPQNDQRRDVHLRDEIRDGYYIFTNDSEVQICVNVLHVEQREPELEKVEFVSFEILEE